MNKPWNVIGIALALSIVAGSVSAQNDRAAAWADSIYTTMSPEQRIGQLFMIRAHSNLGADHVRSVKDQITLYHVGGLCFFQGTPQGHAELINSYQVLSDIPLLVAMDAEWGGGMRFRDKGFSFPRQLMLGAIQDNRLIYDMGRVVGRQLRDVGIHVSFAPVADINNNAANPVIGDRSFGEDRHNVTAKAYQYMMGLQDAGVLPCAKHFPGHGDTDVDSHLDLPVIHHTRARLDTMELYPFRTLIAKGLPAMMVAHLHIPAFDTAANRPTTLSHEVVTGLLRRELGFDGLIFTDALEMKGVTKHYAPGQVELLAFEAGNDILVLPQNMRAAVDTLKAALRSGRLAEQELHTRVTRILRYKYHLGLTDVRNAVVQVGQIGDQSQDTRAHALKSVLVENALTVAANTGGLIPVQQLEDRSFATLMIGASRSGIFAERAEAYVDGDHFAVETSALSGRRSSLLKTLEKKDVVIVGIRGLSRKAEEDFGVTEPVRAFLRDLTAKTGVIVVVFGSPYALQYLADLPHVIVAYEDEPLIHDLAVQGIFGAFTIQGKLPVSTSPEMKAGTGMLSPTLLRLGYAMPERVGLSSDTLKRIEKIVEEMIAQRAAPGCQVLVARYGKVVYEKAFGHFTYDKGRPVELTDLYDLASVTKVTAATLALMRLTDEGYLGLNAPLGMCLPDAEGTNKANMPINSVLSHQAGLKAWIPFYEATVTKGRHAAIPSDKVYQKKPDAKFAIEVAHELYMESGYTDTIWHRILQSPVNPAGKYVYSDLGFLLFSRIVQEQTCKSVDLFCQDVFYKPLGISRLLYNPLSRFPASEIAPTEEDSYFRNQRLQGYVHDMGAAMLGGVSGHAGLFGNARSLAVVMQMLLNGGYYGGQRYLSHEVIQLFTSRVPGSTRRGLGFDMKELDPAKKNPVSPLASHATYGHTGFTGTCVWNDPHAGLTYIFLSNRTYPSMKVNKLSAGEYRERIQTVVYEAVK